MTVEKWEDLKGMVVVLFVSGVEMVAMAV